MVGSFPKEDVPFDVSPPCYGCFHQAGSVASTFSILTTDVTKRAIPNQRKAFGPNNHPRTDNPIEKFTDQYPGKPKVLEPVGRSPRVKGGQSPVFHGERREK